MYCDVNSQVQDAMGNALIRFGGAEMKQQQHGKEEIKYPLSPCDFVHSQLHLTKEWW
jgi:hypothetical protein